MTKAGAHPLEPFSCGYTWLLRWVGEGGKSFPIDSKGTCSRTKWGGPEVYIDIWIHIFQSWQNMRVIPNARAAGTESITRQASQTIEDPHFLGRFYTHTVCLPTLETVKCCHSHPMCHIPGAVEQSETLWVFLSSSHCIVIRYFRVHTPYQHLPVIMPEDMVHESGKIPCPYSMPAFLRESGQL